MFIFPGKSTGEKNRCSCSRKQNPVNNHFGFVEGTQPPGYMYPGNQAECRLNFEHKPEYQ